MFYYESMIASPIAMIEEMSKALNVEVDCIDILTKLTSSSYNTNGPKNDTYHLENLYRKGRITDGREGPGNIN